LVSPTFFKIDWNSFLPQAIAGYFYTGTGSLFPFFPWAGYVIAGGVLGAYLAKHPLVFKSSKFSLTLLISGFILIAISMVIRYAIILAGNEAEVNSASTNLIFFRVGCVLLLNSIVSYISLKVNSIPKLIILIGRNTLMIYVVHLLILYGSAWNPGLYGWIGKTFNGVQAIISAVVMLSLMTFMVMLFNKFKIKNKQLVT
jgi:fucose 4-O-acetylase-like acetyltransferase